MRIASIVEGNGEVSAVPVLLRRVAAEFGCWATATRPIRIQRSRILLDGVLERALDLAAMQAGDGGAILILLDANSDCPATLGPAIRARAVAARSDRSIRVVLAKTEYEAWFLAAASSLAGRRGLAADFAPPPDPENIRDAKGVLTANMPPDQPYRPTQHQAALSATCDLQAARSAPSFDKFWREVRSLVADSPQ